MTKDETERVPDNSETAKIKTSKKDRKKAAAGSQAEINKTSDEDEKAATAKLSAVQLPLQKGEETATFRGDRSGDSVSRGAEVRALTEPGV